MNKCRQKDENYTLQFINLQKGVITHKNKFVKIVLLPERREEENAL